MSKLTLITKPWWASDAAMVDQAATGLFDGMLEPKPGGGFLLRKRPGLQEMFNPGTNSAGQGCYYSERLDALFFVSNGKLWKTTSTSVTVTLVGTGLHATNTVIFAEGQALDSSPIIYMADGTTLKYTTGSSLSVVADAAAPTTATYVTWFSNRFVANEADKGFFYATDVVDPYKWTNSFNPFVAEQRGDNVIALHSFAGELWVSGEEGIEIWHDDGVSPFIPVPSAFIEAGLAAADSLIRIDMAAYGLVKLNGELIICKFTGRSPQPISQSIGVQLNNYSEVSDAIGFHVFHGGASFYVITFPAAGETWAWDIKAEYWGKWGKWNSETGDYDQYVGQYSTFASKWGRFLMQSRTDSRIYAVGRDFYSDGGYTLRTSYYSPTFDHGTLLRKICDEGHLFVKPVDAPEGSVSFSVSWQNDGRDEWSVPLIVSFTKNDLREHSVHMRRLGSYRTRRYNIVMSDYGDLKIGDFELELRKLAI